MIFVEDLGIAVVRLILLGNGLGIILFEIPRA